MLRLSVVACLDESISSWERRDFLLDYLERIMHELLAKWIRVSLHRSSKSLSEEDATVYPGLDRECVRGVGNNAAFSLPSQNCIRHMCSLAKWLSVSQDSGSHPAVVVGGE